MKDTEHTTSGSNEEVESLTLPPPYEPIPVYHSLLQKKRSLMKVFDSTLKVPIELLT